MESDGGTDKKTKSEEESQNNVVETDETEEQRHDKNPGEEDTVSQHNDSPFPVVTEEGASTLEKEKEKETTNDDDLPNIENSQLETSTHLSSPEEGLIKPTVEDTVQHSIVSSQVSSCVLENDGDTALVHKETATIPHTKLSEEKKSPHQHSTTVMEQENPAEEDDITSPGDNNQTPDTTVMGQDMLASGDDNEFPDTKVVEENHEPIDEASDMNLADHDLGITTEFENQSGSETVSNLENNPSQPLIETSVNVENELENDQNSHVLPAGVSGDCDKGLSANHNEGGPTLEPEPMEAMELDAPGSKLVTDASIGSTINNNDANAEATNDEKNDYNNLADHEQGSAMEFENWPGSETVSNLENKPSQPLIETSVNVENEPENDQNSRVLPAGVSGDCDKGTSSDHNEGGATLEPEPMEAMELEVPDSKLVTDASICSTINNNDVNVEATNDEKNDHSKVLVPEGSDADNEIASVTRKAGPPCVPSSDTKSEVGVSESLNNGVHKIGQPPFGLDGTMSAKRSFLSDDTSEGNESGTEEDQSAFTKELYQFFRERNMDFKPPKFYGEGLNCLKLWRAVIRLGGYDKVTGFKLWRQVGESFRPPKTCTTVSWTFRGFYEKTLLEYERQKVIAGELQIPLAIEPEPMNIDNQASGSCRARRDAAARAMQGWHSQNGNSEVNDSAIQDNNLVLHQKRQKSMGTSPGLLKRKRLTSTEHVAKHAIQVSRPMLDVTVVDVGPPAQWVKINVQRTQDCFEVYALVPGLVREEVRVQSDPAGRLVISGEPENPMNPWGATPFKKVVSLPTRIDPHHTSAVVTLNGQLFVRVPLEQSD
ncbi:hypothetical protein Bca101_009337 [Brassica carinata]